MKWLQIQSQKAIQIALRSKALLLTPSKPLLLGSATFLGCYALFESIQRPILNRRNGINPFTQNFSKRPQNDPLLWQRYSKIRFYCTRPHVLHRSDFKELDNSGNYILPRRCNLCGSERFLHPSLRKESKLTPSSSILKMAKDTSHKILPALLKHNSAMKFYLQQFLALLPTAKLIKSTFPFVGINEKLRIYPTKSVRFSKAQYVFYNAAV